MTATAFPSSVSLFLRRLFRVSLLRSPASSSPPACLPAWPCVRLLDDEKRRMGASGRSGEEAAWQVATRRLINTDEREHAFCNASRESYGQMTWSSRVEKIVIMIEVIRCRVTMSSIPQDQKGGKVKRRDDVRGNRQGGSVYLWWSLAPKGNQRYAT